MATADDSDSKFAIEIDDETTLSRGDMVEHKEHGPMHIKSIRVGPHNKTADLQSELGPVGLELTGDEIRDQWGETVHFDPAELHPPGTARYEHEGISVEGLDVEVSITTEGNPEKAAEKAHMHAVDQIVSGLQAVRDDELPSECDGAPFEIDWEGSA